MVNGIGIILGTPSGLLKKIKSYKEMETFTVEQFQENFDTLLSRVENGESFIIEDDGKRVMIVPHNTIKDDLHLLDEFVKNNKNHDDAC